MGAVRSGPRRCLRSGSSSIPPGACCSSPTSSNRLRASAWDKERVVLTSGVCCASSTTIISASSACWRARLLKLPLLLHTSPVVATNAWPTSPVWGTLPLVSTTRGRFSCLYLSLSCALRMRESLCLRGGIMLPKYSMRSSTARPAGLSFERKMIYIPYTKLAGQKREKGSRVKSE